MTAPANMTKGIAQLAYILLERPTPPKVCPPKPALVPPPRSPVEELFDGDWVPPHLGP